MRVTDAGSALIGHLITCLEDGIAAIVRASADSLTDITSDALWEVLCKAQAHSSMDTLAMQYPHVW